jgi:RHS repeat-associated protein
MRAVKIAFALFAFVLGAFNLGPREAHAQTGVPTLSCTPPATDPEIASLARALSYDLNLIYEYIYYNIEFSPTYGSKKGALGTYLAKSGNNIDQNVLFVTLLRQSCITANYREGSLGMPAAMVANLVGVQNDAGLLVRALGAGGIPSCVLITAGGPCATNSSTGAATTVNLWMYWTEATVGTTTYQLDPSWKSYLLWSTVDMATATGYTQSAFLSSALSGSSAGSGLPAGVNSIKSLNKANITSQLNTYSANLAAYLKANYLPNSTKMIFGYRQITSNNFGLLFAAVGNVYTTLPSSLETVYTVTVSDSPNGSSPTISTTLYASQIQGRRLTLTYNGSHQPVLALEGTTIATGAATAAATQTVTMSVQNPYTAPFNGQPARSNIKVGGQFAIILSSGEVGRDELTRHQDKIRVLGQAGNAVNSEPMVGESLAGVGAHYLAQSARAAELIGNLSGVYFARHQVMGVVGATSSTYIDVPAVVDSFRVRSLSISIAAAAGPTFALGTYLSTLESTSVSQLQNIEAVSTVRMFDYANTDGTTFIEATPSNWSTVQPLLTGWNASDVAEMSSWLAADPLSRVFVPRNGARTVGTWTGGGFYEFRGWNGTSSTVTLALASRISGGYNGGYGTDSISGWQSPPPISYYTIGGLVFDYSGAAVGTVSLSTASYNYTTPSTNIGSPSPRSFEPINLYSGGYLYDHEDISTGAGVFPFKLALKRSYDSISSTVKTELGYGWRHNFMMSAAIDSDSYNAFGDYNPLSAVQAAVYAYVASDLLTTTSPTLANTVAASLAANWYMDQLVDNSVTITLDSGVKKYTRIPAAGGGVTYVPPPGDASTLVVNPDGTIQLTDKNQNVVRFDASGNVTSWADPTGNTVTYTYSGTGPSKHLTSVSNGMGRALNFTYTGNQLTKVSDGTTVNGLERAVSYAYDSSGNLASSTYAGANPTTFSYQSGAPGLLTKIFYPNFPTTAFMTNVYDSFGRVKTQADALGNTWTYLFVPGWRGQEIDPAGSSHILYYERTGIQTKDIDQYNELKAMIYDGLGRLTKTTYPLGDSVSLTYDSKNNILSRVTNPMPGSVDPLTGLLPTPLTESWTYDPTFNKVLTATDARGNVTTYTYDTVGNQLTVRQPAVAKPGVTGTVQPVTTNTYLTRGLVQTTTDAEGRVTTFTYDPTTADLLTVKKDTGHLNLQSTYTYDVAGDIATETDPKGNVTTTQRDNQRRVTTVTLPSGVGVIIYGYDANGNQIQKKQLLGPGASLTTSQTYDVRDKVATITLPDGTTKTNTYDALQRLSTETYASGRQVVTEYNKASRIFKVTDKVSGALDPSITVNSGAVVRQQMTYFQDGLQATLTDAKGNTTTYGYDGFKRRNYIAYPDHTNAAPDFDLYAFDANGNELVFQRRDGSQIISTWDALNRRLTKAPSNQPSIGYGYDYTGRMLTALSTIDPVPYQYGYDTAGRKVAEYSPYLGTSSVTLDANGNRTSLTYPPTVGYQAGFDYDALNRMTGVYQGAVSSGIRIAGYTYNAVQRTGILYAPTTVATTSFGYNAGGLLSSVTHNWNGSSLTLGMTYNKDQQRSSLTASDSSFLPSGLAVGSTAYNSNNLNQYPSLTGAGAATYAYDKRGNLTSDGIWTFGYDTETRLISASKTGTSISYTYDTLGRRLFKNVNGTTTGFASYDDQELAEYVGVSALALTRVNLYGPGLDEPVATLTPTGVSYYFQDALGSVIGLANSAGQVTEKYAYTAYGLNTLTGPGTSGYRYAGRRYEPETGLYHYRARAYSPSLGRFLQTDPIGTRGGINLYAYTANDPLNATDPTGLAYENLFQMAPMSPLGTDSFQMAQGIIGPLLYARPPVAPWQELTPLEQIPRGSSGGPNAGLDFPRSFRNDIPEGTPCTYCGQPTTKEPGLPNSLHMDHNIPKVQGGTNEWGNLNPSCATCNLSKGPRTPEQWYMWLRNGGA